MPMFQGYQLLDCLWDRASDRGSRDMLDSLFPPYQESTPRLSSGVAPMTDAFNIRSAPR
jgi:hypothetical protein